MRRTVTSVAVLLTAALLSAAETKTVVLFNGLDLAGWTPKNADRKSNWQPAVVGLAVDSPGKFSVGVPTVPEKGQLWLANVEGGGVDLHTKELFGSGLYELEFMIPKGSNSGVYLLGEYEVQILDSFGKEKVGPGDVGGLYGAAAPRVNAARKPGEWQTLAIEFEAPKFDGEKKVANARFVKVTLNGQVIHENVEMKGPTPGGLTGKEAPTGPLLFQGDHGPVAFRNIKVTPRRE